MQFIRFLGYIFDREGRNNQIYESRDTDVLIIPIQTEKRVNHLACFNLVGN